MTREDLKKVSGQSDSLPFFEKIIPVLKLAMKKGWRFEFGDVGYWNFGVYINTDKKIISVGHRDDLKNSENHASKAWVDFCTNPTQQTLGFFILQYSRWKSHGTVWEDKKRKAHIL